jgi:uncharacterized membrane protein
MSLGTLTLWLHITLMVSAITVSYGPSLLGDLAYRSGRVEAVRGVALASRRLGPLIPVFYVTGGVFGLLTAINFGFNLLAPWLVIAYVLFAIAMISGIGFSGRFGPRVLAATADVPSGPIPPAVSALFTDSTYRFVTILDYVVVIAILFDMVVKPFS